MIKQVNAKPAKISFRYSKYLVSAVLACVLFFLMGQVAYANTYVTVTGSNVNIRSSPEINDTNRITTVPHGTIVRVVDTAGDFFRAWLPDIGYAYISRDWVAFYRTEGTVISPSAWVHDLADTYYGVAVSLVFEGSIVSVVSYYDEWYGILLYGGELAFVERHHLDVTGVLPVPPARQSLPEAAAPASSSTNVSSDVRSDVVARAMGLLGRPYRWGGNGPNSFDCSGFVIYVLRPFGVTLPRRSRDMASSGVHVSRSDLLPGDLVFFATAGGRTVSHVGLYIGGGQFIHSSSSRTGGVVISNLHSAYFTRTFVTARRVL